MVILLLALAGFNSPLVSDYVTAEPPHAIAPPLLSPLRYNQPQAPSQPIREKL